MFFVVAVVSLSRCRLVTQSTPGVNLVSRGWWTVRISWLPIVIALLCSVLVPSTPAVFSAALASGEPLPFDIQAHRGGMGHYPEGTLAAFANALSTGVRTLELDVQITKDGRGVVTHDRRVDRNKCRDTAAARSWCADADLAFGVRAGPGLRCGAGAIHDRAEVRGRGSR